MRFKEAEAAQLKAVDIRRKRAHKSPAAYEPALAAELSSLASVYVQNRRFKESEQAWREALEICRRLATDNPEWRRIRKPAST
jgi:hypothetical protein